MTKLNYHTRRNGHEKYKSKQIKQILPNIIVDNMLGINASVFKYGEKPVVSNVATNSRSRLFFICPFIPVKGIIQVFLETKKELLKLKRKKKTVFCVVSFETHFW